MNRFFWYCIFATISFTTFLTGCKPSHLPSDFPKIYPCEITIEQDNAPLPEAVVTLVSTDSTNGKYTCSGITDENGVALMKTYGELGAPIGKFKVIVKKVKDEGGTKVGDEMSGFSISGAKTFSYVEKNYSSPDTTPLDIEIKKNDNNKKFSAGKATKELIGVL